MNKSTLVWSCSLAVAVSILGVAWQRRPAAGIQAAYRLTPRPADGTLRVRAELRGVRGRSLVLVADLADRLLGIEDLGVLGTSPPSVERERVVSGEDETARGFTRYHLRFAAAPGTVALEYTVRPATYAPPNGDVEQRHLGLVGEEGLFLSLPSFALRPRAPLASVELSWELPPGWRAALEPPTVFAPVDERAWWSTAFAAGDYEAPRALGPRLAFVATRSAHPEVAPAVEQIAQALGRLLGPPRRALTVVVPPRAQDGARVELPASVELATIDGEEPNVGSLRRFVRTLVPLWLGRTRAEIELAQGQESWFALGLVEYLAARVPEDAGLVAARGRQGLEHTWVRQSGFPDLDPDAPDRSPTAQKVRRLQAAAWVQALDRFLAPQGGLDPVLARYSGAGVPRPPADGPLARRVDEFLRAHTGAAPEPLPFEQDWDLELAAAPATAAAGGERRLTLALTAESQGFLETCGCKLSNGGGAARRAQALAELRAARPELALVELGDFSPVELGRPGLDPLVERERGLGLELMGRLGYDAVLVGPDELYSGARDLVAELAGADLPVVASGLEIDGRRPFPSFARLERAGLRIGLAAYEEILEYGQLREAREHHLARTHFTQTLDELTQRIARERAGVDLMVVAGCMTPRSLRALCDPALGVDLVLLRGYLAYPRLPRAAGFEGDTAVVACQGGKTGIDLVELGLSGSGRVRAVEHSVIELPETMAGDADVRARLDEFYASTAPSSDAVEPLFAWDAWHAGEYVGSAACADCHAEEHAAWRATPHATALHTLVDARREHNAKCVACHVVGLGTETGWDFERPAPELAGVGCEVCHGAGADHARDPRAGNVRRSPSQQVCLECHDEKHSEAFPERFLEALERIRH